MVRAGRHGEQEQVALEQGLITIGWNDLPDLSRIRSKDQLTKVYNKIYPGTKKMKAANEIGQIWTFLRKIKKGDHVALPLKTQSAIAIAKVKEDYEYKPIAENVRHIRRVEWLKLLPRSAFDQDLLYSLGAFMTVCQIKRNNAEQRILNMLKEVGLPEEEQESLEKLDIEQYSKDSIIKYISRRFKGHSLARLVEAILQAQGYTTEVSPPGPDGGVDIRAAPGPLGFDHPKICVQVKSSSSPLGVSVLRELRGVMTKLKADQGLLVSWGGFTNDTLREAREEFFSIRLWDQGALLEAIFKYYDRFTDELKAELPLKRIWALIEE